MRILVTGSQGYLAGALLPALAASGHDVVGLDTGWFASCVFGDAPPDPPTLAVDLRDVTEDHLAGVDAVVHLAALSNDPLGDLEPEVTHAINHAASVRLAEAARRAGVRRFVYSSTCSVYGSSGGDALVDEDAPLAPVTAYAVSKVRAERDLHALGTGAFTMTALRNATVYGIAPRLRADLVVHDLAVAAVHEGVALVKSDGTPWRPLVHVEDVARAFVAVLEAPVDAIAGQSFNSGRQGEDHRVVDVARAVAACVPGCEVRVTGEAGADPRSYRVDVGRLAAAVPAFRPTWTLAAGAEQVVQAVRASPLSAADYSERFVRLRWLKALQQDRRLDADLRWLAPDLRGRQAP